ncbi:MAG TPA: hypothetical protein VKY82_06110 [Flavobacterium sp.]|nr:hypothetical protein [Flavobacterium sp.]
MKLWYTLALLAITTIASAQPGHHKHRKGKKVHKKHYTHKHYDTRGLKRQVVKVHHGRDYHYYVNREMARFEFLRLSRQQKAKLQISLNFLISNGYSPQIYERRLRSDLRTILSRSQYQQWERRAYGNNNVFVFNFVR